MSIDLEYAWFKKKIEEIAGVSLDSYRPEQMRRLMDKMLDQHGIRNYVEYIKYLKEDPARVQEFKDSMTINVSSLFRDHARWVELNAKLTEYVRKIEPGRNGERRDFLAWSAGCSIGAEPFTISMLLKELSTTPGMPHFSFEILCTDIDPNILKRARDGIFTDRETGEVPQRLMKKYFKEIPPPAASWSGKSVATAFYSASDALRQQLRFKLHNLHDEKWETGFDLITCRNVMIYFTGEIKKRLFNRFRDALKDGGLLFLGGTEVIFSPSVFGLESIATGIYRKTGQPAEKDKQ